MAGARTVPLVAASGRVAFAPLSRVDPELRVDVLSSTEEAHKQGDLVLRRHRNPEPGNRRRRRGVGPLGISGIQDESDRMWPHRSPWFETAKSNSYQCRSLPAGNSAVVKKCAPVIQHGTLTGDLMQYQIVDQVFAFFHEIVIDHDAALSRVARVNMGGNDDGG